MEFHGVAKIERLRTSQDMNSILEALRFAGDRQEIIRYVALIEKTVGALDIPPEFLKSIEIGRAIKKNFAQRLSTALAQKIADAYRLKLKSILPDADGRRHESRTMGAGGLKKLDVNYSTPEIGLGLGLSVKTINFRDAKTKRFTKNVKRVDGELRAEAEDVHKRQPFSVVAALVFIPREATIDGVGGRSSVWHLWDVLHRRCGRVDTKNDHSKLELGFIGVYDCSGPNAGAVSFLDSSTAPPVKGWPETETLLFRDVLDSVERTFLQRNKVR